MKNKMLNELKYQIKELKKKLRLYPSITDQGENEIRPKEEWLNRFKFEFDYELNQIIEDSLKVLMRIYVSMNQNCLIIDCRLCPFEGERFGRVRHHMMYSLLCNDFKGLDKAIDSASEIPINNYPEALKLDWDRFHELIVDLLELVKLKAAKLGE